MHGLIYIPFACSLFFKQEMELSLIGLQNAGKTSLVNVVAVMKCLYPSTRFYLYLSLDLLIIYCTDFRLWSFLMLVACCLCS